MSITKVRPSFTFTEERLAELQQVVPEAFADGQINWPALKEALGEYLEPDDAEAEHFGLFWPGKREARRLAALPSRGTLVPALGEGVREKTSKNLFIEGDNLEVIKLLQKAYAGRVRFVYVDPPFNTGNDIVYSDDFSDPLGDYLRKTGQADEKGEPLTTNTRADGRFHSKWLSMMYPRLRLARSLLKEDGLIAVSIDDNEVHSLRFLMNEVFGEEAFLLCVTWRRRQVPDNRNVNQASTDHEYVLVYGREMGRMRGTAKDLDKYQNPDKDPRGPWMSDNLTGLATKEQRPNLHYDIVHPKTGKHYSPSASRGWAYNRESMQRLIEDDRILWPTTPDGRPRLKRFLADMRSQFTGFSSVQDFGYTTDGAREIDELFGRRVFPFAKPVKLIKSLVQQATSAIEQDIVLDFFAGSCTSAQAVLELNREDGGRRQTICVQLEEPAGDPQYATVAEIGKDRFRRVIKKLQKDAKPRPDEDLGFRAFKLTSSNFKAWEDYSGNDPSELELRFAEADDPLVSGWTPENLLVEVMLLEGFPLDSNVEPLDGIKGNEVQVVTSEHCTHRLLVCFDRRLKEQTVAHVQFEDQDVFICLDKAVSDQLKLQLADRCTLKTI